MSALPVPHDIDAEESVLGAMILSQEAVARMVDLLHAADFYKPSNGHIFAAMESLYRRGEKCDAVTVVAEIQRSGLIDAVGDKSIFIGLQANVPSVANVGHYAGIVVNHSISRAAIGQSQSAIDRLRAWADPVETIDELQTALASIDLPASSDRQQARTLDEIILDSDRMAPWVIPGLIRVDWRILLVAGEGAGKSTLFRQIAACAAQGIHPLRNARIEPVKVLIVDLENPAAAIAETGAMLRDRIVREIGAAYAPGNLRILMRSGGINLRTRHDRTELENEITIHKPSLVCIGPAYKMLNRREGRGGQESHEEATDPVLRVLDDLRTRHRFALMIEHHAPQGHGPSRELRPYGSQRWLAWPEMGLTMHCEKGTEWRYEVGRFRGDRLKSDWPDELHRSDRMPPGSARAWPWAGMWKRGMPELAPVEARDDF